MIADSSCENDHHSLSLTDCNLEKLAKDQKRSLSDAEALAACARVIACFKVKQEAANAEIERQKERLQLCSNTIFNLKKDYGAQYDRAEAAEARVRELEGAQ